jgi:hypothetical protein
VLTKDEAAIEVSAAAGLVSIIVTCGPLQLWPVIRKMTEIGLEAAPSPWPRYADKKSHSGQTFAQPIAESLIPAQG